MNISCAADIEQGEYSRDQVWHIAEPYAFDFVLWELQAVSSMLGEVFSEQGRSDQEIELRSQIEAVLSDKGIPLFPPLNFSLEEPPHLLVVSPRERILYLDRVVLRQDISVKEMEMIEAQVDELGVSSLVEGLGGFGATYPPIVDDANLTFTIDAVTEEWLHQYLAFRPLGFLYLLDSIGIRQDPDVIIMNETLAGMVSREIGSEVLEQYYNGAKKVTEGENIPDFDFDTEMRETRRMADLYLSRSDVEGAESYMEERRHMFVSHGYNIRKLNQAYFAFHGIYGDSPASVSPVYEDMQQLRDKSLSLKGFLDRTSAMTDYATLKEALNN